jgi:hypothetical protein
MRQESCYILKYVCTKKICYKKKVLFHYNDYFKRWGLEEIEIREKSPSKSNKKAILSLSHIASHQ